MAIFEVQGADGKIYEVEAPSMEAAAEAIGSFGAMPKGGSSVNPEGMADFQNRALTFGANAAQGMSFGLGDETSGAIAGIKSMMGGGEYLPAYRAERDDARADMATISERYPNAATGGYLTGAAIPAITAGPLATGESMLGTMGRSGLLGMTEGGLQGAGNADGRGIVGETIKGGLIGLGAGIAAPAVIGAATLAKRGFFEGLPQMFGKASQTKANRAIADALMRSGKTAPDVDALIAAAAREGQPEYRLMDALGLPGQRAANGLTRAGGAPGDEVAEFLSTRQAGQPERVGAFVEDAFGFTKKPTVAKNTEVVPLDYKFTDSPADVLARPQKSAADLKAKLTEARGNTADKAYDAARGNAAPVDVRGALGVIDARIGGMKGSGVTGDGIDAKLLGYRDRLAAQPGPDGVMRELSDFDRVLGVKQAVQDDIGAAVRAGRNNEARELGKLVKELDAALEGSSDMYRTANDGFRSASKVIDAVDEGAMMATRGRAADNVPRFGAMAAAEQGAARTGYGDRLLAQLETMASPTANRAKPLLSPKRAMEADAMATDPRLYSDRLGRENTMWETQNRALGGSRTADNLADQGAMDGISGEVMQAGKAAANLQFGDMVQKVAGALGPILKGQNEPTRMLIAQALMSSNAGQVLAPAIAQATKSAGVRRILEALLRQPMREGGEALAQ